MKTIATVGGLGYSPVAPGTIGSAVGLGMAWILSGNPSQQMIGCLVASGLGFWSSGPTARLLGEKDAQPIIIDEVAGMMIGVVLLPATWKIYLAGFLLFRVLDIFKPGPIGRLERLPGGVGIMADDLLAGVVTHLLLRLGLNFL